jgi:cytoskeletal protein RodZ
MMPREELQAIGQQLRAVRLERDHTLDEVAAATRIRLKFLEAIEAGEPDPTLSEMQLRGFLRNYASYLHLDLDAMLAAYQHVLENRSSPRFGLFKGSKEQLPPAVPIIPLYGKDPVKTPPGPIPRVARPRGGTDEFASMETVGRSRLTQLALILGTIIALALVVIALAAGVVAFSQLSDSDVPSTPPAMAIEDADDISATDDMSMMEEAGDLIPEEPSATPSPTTGAGGVIVNTPSMTGADQIAISLEATQRSWVRLVVDGTVEYEGLLRPGTALQYQGRQSITLRTSNAGGLDVVVNNQPLGNLGARGEGYEQTFTLDVPIVPNTGPSPTPTLPVATQATTIPTDNLPTLPPPPPPLVTEEAAP